MKKAFRFKQSRYMPRRNSGAKKKHQPGIFENQLEILESPVEVDSSSHALQFLRLKDDLTKRYIKKTYERTPHSTSTSGVPLVSGLLGSVVGVSKRIEPSSEIYPFLAGQLEAFYSIIYRFLMGKAAAKTVPLYAGSSDIQNPICIGSVSEVLPNFISARKQRINFEKFKHQLARMLVASYVLGEDDLHKCNYGMAYGDNADDPLRVVRLDFDMTGWYDGADNKGERLVSQLGFCSAAGKSFKITKRDIIDFPLLHDASPFYWPTASYYYFDDAQDFVNLKDDIEFNRYKYIYLYLFAMLLTPDIQACADNYIQDEFKDQKDRHVRSLKGRREQIMEILYECKAFRCVMLNEGDFHLDGFDPWEVIESALNEFLVILKEDDTIDIGFEIDCYKSLYKRNLDKIRRDFDADSDELRGKFPNQNNYQPFEIPAKHIQLYIKRKEKIREMIKHRLDREQEKDQSIFGLASKAIDMGIRGANVKVLKMQWLIEVLKNADEDIARDQDDTDTTPMQSLLNWFATKHAPPFINTGSTGMLIKSIKQGEDAFGKILRSDKDEKSKIDLLILENAKLGSFDTGLKAHETEGDSLAYLECVKFLLVENINSLIEEKGYKQEPSALDIKAAYYGDNARQQKFRYWNRVKTSIDRATSWELLREAFDLKREHHEFQNRENILDGKTNQFRNDCLRLLAEANQSGNTMANHAIEALRLFLYEIFPNTEVKSSVLSGFSFWGKTSDTACVKRSILTAMHTLADKEVAVFDCLKALQATLTPTGYHEHEIFLRILKHFERCHIYQESVSIDSAALAETTATMTSSFSHLVMDP